MQLPFPWRSGQAKPFASIPRINWSHPLAAGLTIYCYDAGGVILDLVNGGASTPTSITGTGGTKVGSGMQFPTSNSFAFLPQNPAASALATVNPYSVAIG